MPPFALHARDVRAEVDVLVQLTLRRRAARTRRDLAAEAEAIVKTIEHMIGGHSFFSIDSGRSTGAARTDRSFADFAVLYRTASQSAAICQALGRSGIPYKKGAHTPLADDPTIRALLQDLHGIVAADGGSLTDDLRAAAKRIEERGESAPRGNAKIGTPPEKVTGNT